MNIASDFPVTVFKNEQGRYSIGLSDKKEAGKYVNWYKPCSFKKDVVLENRTKIKIKTAWFKCNEYNGKKYEYIFISEFIVVKDDEPKAAVADDPFKDYPEECALSDDDLPF